MREVRFQDAFLWGMSRMTPPIQPFPDGPILNLGAGRKVLPFSTVNLDLPKWDARVDTIPYATGKVAGIIALHFLEHLDGDVVMRVLGEAERALMSGGSMLIAVPYYNSQVQAQNLDHRSVYCEETWRNVFEDETYDRGTRGEWRLRVGFNLICGIVERNLCLMTQLVKE